MKTRSIAREKEVVQNGDKATPEFRQKTSLGLQATQENTGTLTRKRSDMSEGQCDLGMAI